MHISLRRQLDDCGREAPHRPLSTSRRHLVREDDIGRRHLVVKCQHWGWRGGCRWRRAHALWWRRRRDSLFIEELQAGHVLPHAPKERCRAWIYWLRWADRGLPRRCPPRGRPRQPSLAGFDDPLSPRRLGRRPGSSTLADRERTSSAVGTAPPPTSVLQLRAVGGGPARKREARALLRRCHRSVMPGTTAPFGEAEERLAAPSWRGWGRGRGGAEGKAAAGFRAIVATAPGGPAAPATSTSFRPLLATGATTSLGA
mmetsp:Transcript_16733/g.43411  ORF Transcript_16733/g.43411 Transcript_16733/m.43411 type:complete len:257 (-) Transcript_16733:19-789(-)